MNPSLLIIAAFCVSTLLGFALPFLLAVAWQRGGRKEIAVILAALAVVGACAGTAGGMSRVGAVGSIIPAFLGLLGGLSIYLFGVDRSKGLISSFSAAAIAISLIVSYTVTSQFRNVGDDHRDIRAHCARAYTDAKLLSDAASFAKFRERMGQLCDKAMSWHVSG